MIGLLVALGCAPEGVAVVRVPAGWEEPAAAFAWRSARDGCDAPGELALIEVRGGTLAFRGERCSTVDALARAVEPRAEANRAWQERCGRIEVPRVLVAFDAGTTMETVGWTLWELGKLGVEARLLVEADAVVAPYEGCDPETVHVDLGFSGTVATEEVERRGTPSDRRHVAVSTPGDVAWGEAMEALARQGPADVITLWSGLHERRSVAPRRPSVPSAVVDPWNAETVEVLGWTPPVYDGPCAKSSLLLQAIEEAGAAGEP